ncbi:MAG: glycosyl hydrolase [Bacteroidota bacterium]
MKSIFLISALVVLAGCNTPTQTEQPIAEEQTHPGQEVKGKTVNIIYSFESGTQSWVEDNATGGPWSVTEWASSGTRSLKADMNLSGGSVFLRLTDNLDFSSSTDFVATVRHASWGNHGSGTQAKLYVKTGSSWAWFDGGSTSISASTSGTILRMDLSVVSNTNQIREIGVEFIPAGNASGSTAIYVDEVALESGSGGGSPSVFTPVTPNYNSTTYDVLNILGNLPIKNADRTVSGQFLGYSGFGFNTSLLTTIFSATGQYPGLAGADLANGGDGNRTFFEVFNASANASLEAHWDNGGLVTINHHFPNPLRTNGMAGMGAVGRETTANINNMLYGPDLNNPDKDRWYGALWEIYLGLLDMKNRGVTIIYRPLHEMNGDWFWYGGLGTSSRPNSSTDDYKNMWNSIFDYMTTSKGAGYPALDNLIWVYSPDYSRSGVTNYVVQDKTDIVALDAYLDNPGTNSTLYNRYQEMLTLNKPFAFGEIGPNNQRTDGQFDYNDWLEAIRSRFGETIYFLAWNDFGAVKIAPTSNLNASDLYNKYDWMLNRGEEPLR